MVYLLSNATSFIPLFTCMTSLWIESKIIPSLLNDVSIIPILCSSSSLIWPACTKKECWRWVTNCNKMRTIISITIYWNNMTTLKFSYRSSDLKIRTRTQTSGSIGVFSTIHVTLSSSRITKTVKEFLASGFNKQASQRLCRTLYKMESYICFLDQTTCASNCWKF